MSRWDRRRTARDLSERHLTERAWLIRCFATARDAGRRLADAARDAAPASARSCSGSPGAASRSRTRSRGRSARRSTWSIVRKLGRALQPELGMGAIGEDGARVAQPRACSRWPTSPARSWRRSRRASGPSSNGAPGRYRGEPTDVSLAEPDGDHRRRRPRNGRRRLAPRSEVAREHGAARVVLAVPIAPPRIGGGAASTTPTR